MTKIKSYYFKCQTPKEIIHIKIKATNDTEAENKLLSDYKNINIISMETNRKNVDYEFNSNDPFRRNHYPYIKNTRGKAIRIYG